MKLQHQKREFYPQENTILGQIIKQPPIKDTIDLLPIEEEKSIEDLSKLPKFKNPYNKYIPNKVRRKLERYIPKAELREIHPDADTAIELCLLFLSNLSNAFYVNETVGWKSLNASILRKQLSTNNNDSTYLKVINLLITHGILERGSYYIVGEKSYNYRLTEEYRNKGVREFSFRTEHVKRLLKRDQEKLLQEISGNIIADNLKIIYLTAILPTKEEILERAKKLVSEGFKTKKGKTLTFLGKNSVKSYKTPETRSFVETDIELFERLTVGGYLIPTISDTNAGGRVVDSFTLMPSWIREMVTFSGEETVEVDYSCLHPNIVSALLGEGNNINHDEVADFLKISRTEAKIEHLSFFNRRVIRPRETKEQKEKRGTAKYVYHKLMQDSPLYDYYIAYEPKMLLAVMEQKLDYGYKATTKMLFSQEVVLMTEVIRILNEEGIYVGYIYDALFCKKTDRDRVVQVMNEVAEQYGIPTKAV